MDFQSPYIALEQFQKLINHRKDLAIEMWNNNRKLPIENDTPSCEWTMKDENKEGELIKISTFTSGKERITQNVRAIQLPALTLNPPMKMWIPTKRNFMVPDVTELSHVPYLGEDVEDFLIADLVKSYDGKTYGGKNEDVMDDDMFVDLVKALTDLYNASDASRNSIANSIPKIIFEKVLVLFPTTTVAQLHEKRLTVKICESKPNIDDPNAMTEGLQREDALSSYRKYLCRRCFIYNCQLHGIENNNPKPRIQTDKQINFRLEEPCSDACYKHLIESFSEEGNSEEYEENTSVQNTKWSGPEETLFLALCAVFPNNSCAIAKTIMTKSCQQVYEYFKMTNLRANLKPVNEAIVKTKTKLQLPKKRSSYNEKHSQRMYKPCVHEGNCNGENCSCVNCEKHCNCPEDCKKRFSTCKCSKQCTSNTCFCFSARRECSDTCKCCTSEKLCKNTAIQQGLRKNVKIAPSDVHGWGLFMQEICQKGELIGEYCGEIISKKETERRLKVYDIINYNYIFDLNEEFDIDSATYGSDVRFINYSKNPNCEAKVLMVNGDHRIGIYANRTIQEGEELFLDYITMDPTESKNESENENLT